ncbi:MAG: LmeA family phospholipid-binding protein [Solirubrobacterales bacterium]
MRRGGPNSRITRVALAVAGGALLLLVLAQVLLPRIAASRISSRLSTYGSVQSVSVTAWPAVKLLWGSVDSVTARARRLKVSPAQTAKLLWEARDVSEMKLTAASVQEGPLQLTDISFRKRGGALSAQALTTEAAVKAALPEGFGVQLLGSEGRTVRVRASGGLFGVGASVDAVAGASEGKLVVHPMGFLVESLQITLFADQHVYVRGVGASAVPDPGGGQSYRLSMTASLH